MKTKQYLNYNEYKEFGGTLDKVPFELSEEEAELTINKHTMNRLVNLEEQDNVVKKCMFKLIYTINYNGNYLEAKEDEKEKIKYNIVFEYLINYIVNGVPALYRGVN